jgi:hypothetical protein
VRVDRTTELNCVIRDLLVDGVIVCVELVLLRFGNCGRLGGGGIIKSYFFNSAVTMHANNPGVSDVKPH